MAFLEQRGRSFRIIFRFAGARYAKALNTHDERAARASLARVEDKLHRLELGTLNVPESVDLVTFVVGDGTNSTKPQPLVAPHGQRAPLGLSDLFAAYWAKLPEGNLELSTITGMKIHQRQLERHFGKRFSISGLKLTDLQGYVEKRSRDKGLRGRTVTAATIRKAIVTLRTVWNWGRQHELVERPFPSKGLRFPKGTEKPPFMTFTEVQRRAKGATPAEAADLWECAFLSLSELDELLQLVKQRAGHSCVYPMFVFAAHTGARRSELIRSTLDDLDFDHNLITIHERKKSHDKRTTRRVPMSALLRAVLQDILQRHPGIHSTFWHEPSIRGHHCVEPKPLDADTAHGHFKRILAGSKWEKLRGWHIFRHSFCSNCAAKGIDQRIIDAWVGHLSPEMVRRYRHLLPDQQQTAINIVFGNYVEL